MDNNISRNLEDALNFIENIDVTTIQLDCCKRVDKGSMWDLRKHAHNVIEIIYMIDAKAHISIQDRTLHSTGYDIVVYPPHYLHQEYIDINQTQKCIYIRFDVKSTVQLQSSFQIRDLEGKIEWLLEEIARLSIQDEHSNTQNRLIEVYIEAILLNIAQNIKKLSSRNPEIVHLAINYMRHNYCEDISMDKLANIFYISPSYLSRLFHNKVHISPMNYLKIVRLEVAKKLLLKGTEPIGNIASAIGISDAKYFSRVFKQYTGKTPTEYRSGKM